MATSSNRRDDGGCDATVQKTAFDAPPPLSLRQRVKKLWRIVKNLIAPDYVVRLDKESGAVVKVYADGRVESILD